MACSPQRAQAIHSVDEAWTEVIDHMLDSWPEATKQLRVLARWRANPSGPPPGIGPVALKRLAELAWLAFSEAALRAVEIRNGGDEEDRVPCE